MPSKIDSLYFASFELFHFMRQAFKLLQKMSKFPINKSNEEWRAILSPEQFQILRNKGTERPGTGEYWKTKANGIYNCAGCQNPIYKSSTKFDAHCGWPAFYEAIPGSLVYKTDETLGMTRTEMMCAKCGGHLGHVFKGEGYDTPTDERHCANSIALKFEPEK